MSESKKLANIISTLILLALAVVLTYFSLKQQSSTEKIKNELAEELTNVIEESKTKPSEYPDYDAIKGKIPDPKITHEELTKDCPAGGCVNDKPASKDFDGITKTYKITGKFSRAYLFIEVLVDYTRPLTIWDDIYFTMNGMGGHIVSEENILLVPTSDKSRYLYDLRSMSFYPTIENKEKKENKKTNLNLFSLLQDTMEINTKVTISSDRPGRVMREISIYYECFEGSECSIEEKAL